MSNIPTPGDDTLDGAIDAPDTLSGDAGDDLILGNGSGPGDTDQLSGDAGNDTLIGGDGSNVLTGGDGNDSILAGASGVTTGSGGAGNDTLLGGAGADFLAGDDNDIGGGGSTVAGADVLAGGAGNDILSGGPGDDILDPGTADVGGADLVLGGTGIDTLVLPGQPADYTFTISGTSRFVTSTAGVNVEVDGVERVAFGVTAEELAAGATPLTVVDFGSLYAGSSSDLVGVPPLAFSDTIVSAFGTTQVLIDLRSIRDNDYDPDGDLQLLVGFNTITPAGVSTTALLTAIDVDAAGFNAALYPLGLLVVDLASPLAGPIKLQYRSVLEDQVSGTTDTSSQATITINPAQAVNDRIIGSFGAETFIPYAQLLANDGPGAVFGGISNAYLFGGSIVNNPGRGGIVVTSTNFNRDGGSFEYSLVGFSGTALVELDLNNSPPINTPIARVVTPGTSFSLSFDDIRYKAGNFDPDNTGLPPLVQVSGAAGAGVTYSLSATGIDLTFAPGYAGDFSLSYTLTDQPLRATSLPSTISFLTAAPPPPVAGNEVLNWGINSDGRTIFQGGVPGFGVLYSRELLANDVAMPGTVVLANFPRDTDGGPQTLAIAGIQYGIPGFNGVTSRSDTSFGFEFKDNFTGSDTYEYVIADPLGRTATGLITLNVNIPQPVLTNNVILVPVGATSITVTAAEILANDVFSGSGTGAIAEIVPNVRTADEFIAVDSGVPIGAGYTRIDGFTLTFDPIRTLDSYDFNVRTFDTAAAGGSASGFQKVTFQQAGAPTAYRFAELSETFQEGFAWAFILERSGVLDEAEVLFTIRSALSGPSADGSDVGGFDVQSQTTFGVGQSSVIIGGGIVDDALVEPNESFRVTLDLVRGVGGGSNPGVIDPAASVFVATILNDDFEQVFVATSLPSLVEGDGNRLGFLLQRDLTAVGAITVTYVIEGGTAQSADVAGGFTTGSVTFAAGEFQKLVEVEVFDDTLVEGPETVQLRLTGATGAVLSGTLPLSGTTTIFDNDTPPATTYRLDAVITTTQEGTATGLSLPFTISRTGTLDAATVTFSVAAGLTGDPAEAGDLVGGFRSATISFAAGEIAKTVGIGVVNDANFEPDETFRITLDSATNTGQAVVLDPTASVIAATILNDDLPNRPPTDIALDTASVRENLPIGTLVGQLAATDPDTGDSQTFSFAPGGNPGGLFSITGNQLRTAAVLDFEAAATRSVTLRVTDAAGATYDETFTIAIGDVSEGPTNGDDFITGTPQPDAINARRGDDTVLGLADADTLDGAQGNDSLRGDGGDDSLAGGSGDDTLDGGDGNDLLAGGSGENSLVGGDGADTIEGGSGFDRINGDAGADLLFGNGGDDDVRGGDGNDTLRGGAGFNQLSGDDGDDLLFVGESGVLFGGADQDTLVGGAGDDFLGGNSGNDSMTGAAGNDTLIGDAGDDTVRAGQGDDSVEAGSGADNVNGGDGDDTVTGNAGDDTLLGAQGADSLLGGDGLDILEGGDGNDTLQGGNDADSIAGGLANDVLAGDAGDDTLRAGQGDDTADGGTGADLLFGAAGADSLYGGFASGGLSTDADTLIGGAGADTLEGGDDTGFFNGFTPNGNGIPIGGIFTAGDRIDLRAPGGGGDGALDVVIYGTRSNAFGVAEDDGFDLVLGFEAGIDRVLVSGSFGGVPVLTPTLTAAGGSTFVTFDGASGPQFGAGLVIEGVTGLTAAFVTTATSSDWIIS